MSELPYMIMTVDVRQQYRAQAAGHYARQRIGSRADGVGEGQSRVSQRFSSAVGKD